MSSIVTSPTSQRRPGVGSLSKAVNEPEAIAANLVVYRQMGLRHPYGTIQIKLLLGNTFKEITDPKTCNGTEGD